MTFSESFYDEYGCSPDEALECMFEEIRTVNRYQEVHQLAVAAESRLKLTPTPRFTSQDVIFLKSIGISLSDPEIALKLLDMP